MLWYAEKIKLNSLLSPYLKNGLLTRQSVLILTCII